MGNLRPRPPVSRVALVPTLLVGAVLCAVFMRYVSSGGTLLSVNTAQGSGDSAAAATAAPAAEHDSAQDAAKEPATEWQVDLHQKADKKLTQRIMKIAGATDGPAAYAKCRPGQLNVTLQPLDFQAMGNLLLKSGELKGHTARATIDNVPCKQQNGKQPKAAESSCCQHEFFFRFGTTDFAVFEQIFQNHYLKALYALYKKSQPPKYILDAGANAGFSATLFKLLFPDATVVCLEPDPLNFAVLQNNTKGFDKVHTLNAGLWGRKADITLAQSYGEWGRIFREAEPGEEGMPAYSVKDIMEKFSIPAFDYIKIDIEGAEGVVFAPDADVSWIHSTKLISLEVHDFMASHFGLAAVSSRIDAAFQGTNFAIAADNEHVFYISPELVQQLP